MRHHYAPGESVGQRPVVSIGCSCRWPRNLGRAARAGQLTNRRVITNVSRGARPQPAAISTIAVAHAPAHSQRTRRATRGGESRAASSSAQRGPPETTSSMSSERSSPSTYSRRRDDTRTPGDRRATRMAGGRVAGDVHGSAAGSVAARCKSSDAGHWGVVGVTGTHAPPPPPPLARRCVASSA